MFSLAKPNEKMLQEIISSASSESVTYSDVGITRSGATTAGYRTDRLREIVGHGEQTFLACKLALMEWKEFDTGWTMLFPVSCEFRVDSIVVVSAYFVGIWVLNACRITYVIDEDRRFGFGYGTLPCHAETGEERFLIEWDESSDAVSYEILAFSRPSRWYLWLGLPLHRYAQNKFRHDSMRALRKTILSPD